MWKVVNCLTCMTEMWTDGALAWPMACFVAKKEMANTGAQFFVFHFGVW